jgi:hypothetical protein
MDDVQDVEQLALVLVNALDLHIEQGAGVETHAAIGLDQARQPHLVVVLDLLPLGLELGVPRRGAPACATRQLGDPAGPMVSVISAFRPGLQLASQRRWVTPLVLLLNLCGHSS